MWENGAKGENLVFLISQPRAGSTMVQKILAGHPEIHTLAEPWVALYPLLALRGQDGSLVLDPRLPPEGIQDFLRHLPEGEGTYWVGVRRMLTYLYACALEGSGKNIFLDKTPR